MSIEEAFADHMVPAIAIVAGLLVAVTSIVSSNWRQVTINRQQAELKNSLLEKGMSAEEIAKVMDAGQKVGKKGCC